MEAMPNVDLRNPFGMANVIIEDRDKEGIHEIPEANDTHPTTFTEAMTSYDLEELVGNDFVAWQGIKSTIVISPGKWVHKVRVLCENMKYLRQPYLKDQL